MRHNISANVILSVGLALGVVTSVLGAVEPWEPAMVLGMFLCLLSGGTLLGMHVPASRSAAVNTRRLINRSMRSRTALRPMMPRH